MHQSENIKIKLITILNKDEHSLLILLYARVNETIDAQRKNTSNRGAALEWSVRILLGLGMWEGGEG